MLRQIFVRSGVTPRTFNSLLALTSTRTIIHQFNLPKDKNFFSAPPELEKIPFNDLVQKHFDKQLPKNRVGGVSGEWATALFVYGGVLNARKQIEKDLRSLFDGSNKSAAKLVRPETPFDEVNKLLKDVIQRGNLHKQTVLFLNKANEKNLLWLVPKITKKFFQLMDDINNVKEAVIASGTPMSKQEFEDAIEFTERVYLNNEYKLRASHLLDPKLIGGWEARVGADLFGHAYSAKVNHLQSLYEREVSDLNDAMDRAINKI